MERLGCGLVYKEVSLRSKCCPEEQVRGEGCFLQSSGAWHRHWQASLAATCLSHHWGCGQGCKELPGGVQRGPLVLSDSLQAAQPLEAQG